jgi:hypothetical protein
MDIIKDAIERDGIALARVPAKLDMEISKYGGNTAIEILQFRASCFPDASSWRILEVCVLTVVKWLKSRIHLAESVARDRANYMHSIDYKTELNGFRDILLIFLRRYWKSKDEVDVFSSFL